MAWYRCLVRGENFPGEMVGETGLVGFYVTRFVEAIDHDDAETVALRALKADPMLTPPPGYVPTGQARVFFEEIEEVSPDRVPPNEPGFAWHPMVDAATGQNTPSDPS